MYFGVATVALAGALYAVRNRAGDDTGALPDGRMVAVTQPGNLTETARRGQASFSENCAACHGPDASGLDGAGPPLVHKIYEPSHHADVSFFLAVEQGVRAHHWRFGNMPPVEWVGRAEIGTIVAYVRELQRANGIH